MAYVDGFLLPLAEDKLDDYRKIAQTACDVWMEYGALDYKECVLDHVQQDEFKSLFPQMAGVKEGEVVIFAFITYPDRASRDAINAKVMADSRIQDSCNPETAPFDMSRMAWGGFRVLVDGAG